MTKHKKPYTLFQEDSSLTDVVRDLIDDSLLDSSHGGAGEHMASKAVYAFLRQLAYKNPNRGAVSAPLKAIRHIMTETEESGESGAEQRVESLFCMLDSLEAKCQEDIAAGNDAKESIVTLDGLASWFLTSATYPGWEHHPRLRSLALQRIYLYCQHEHERWQHLSPATASSPASTPRGDNASESGCASVGVAPSSPDNQRHQTAAETLSSPWSEGPGQHTSADDVREPSSGGKTSRSLKKLLSSSAKLITPPKESEEKRAAKEAAKEARKAEKQEKKAEKEEKKAVKQARKAEKELARAVRAGADPRGELMREDYRQCWRRTFQSLPPLATGKQSKLTKAMLKRFAPGGVETAAVSTAAAMSVAAHAAQSPAVSPPKAAGGGEGPPLSAAGSQSLSPSLSLSTDVTCSSSGTAVAPPPTRGGSPSHAAARGGLVAAHYDDGTTTEDESEVGRRVSSGATSDDEDDDGALVLRRSHTGGRPSNGYSGGKPLALRSISLPPPAGSRRSLSPPKQVASGPVLTKQTSAAGRVGGGAGATAAQQRLVSDFERFKAMRAAGASSVAGPPQQQQQQWRS